MCSTGEGKVLELSFPNMTVVSEAALALPGEAGCWGVEACDSEIQTYWAWLCEIREYSCWSSKCVQLKMVLLFVSAILLIPIVCPTSFPTYLSCPPDSRAAAVYAA